MIDGVEGCWLVQQQENDALFIIDWFQYIILEHVETLSRDCGVSYKQTEDFHSDNYHTNNPSDAWLQLFQ